MLTNLALLFFCSGSAALRVYDYLERKRLRATVADLREVISEREFMTESVLNQAYEQGWNARTAFLAPMNFAHVRAAREKSN